MVCRGQGKETEVGGRTCLPPRLQILSHQCSFLQITYVDFLVYDVLDMHRLFEPKSLYAFPNLKDFLARFEVMP